MRAGRLRHQIEIQSLVPVQDADTGVITETPVLFAKVRAGFRAATVREFIGAGITQAKIVGAFELRYIAGVKPSMRIMHRDHLYNIEGALPDDGSGVDELTLPVSEIVSG